MRAEILQLAADLSRRGEPFALATVIRREAPSSARLGDGALITAGGTFHGWLGGSCTQPTVVREALTAIQTATPRLMALSPTPEAETRPGVTAVAMTCHSGGSVDIYVEPVLPAPRLLIFGTSPTARALVRIGKVLGYTIEAVDPDADVASFPEADWVVTDFASADLAQRSKPDPSRLFAVVATLGERDEAAIRTAVTLEATYIGLVASRKRYAQVQELLADQGMAAEQLALVRSPAGLDIGAVSPEEIALSVLAEIVQVTRTVPDDPEVPDVAVAPVAPAEEIDPVCGMGVLPASAKHQAEFGGRNYYFCSGGCREHFITAPLKYISTGTASDGIG